MTYSRFVDIRSNHEQEIEYQNLYDVIGAKLVGQIKLLKHKLGLTVNVLGGGGGSGLQLYMCLPLVEKPTLQMSVVDINRDGADCMRDWLKGFDFRLHVGQSIQKVPRDTEHLVYRFDIDGSPSLAAEDIAAIERMKNLRVMTLIPPIDRHKGGIEVPRWVDRCRWLQKCSTHAEKVSWHIASHSPMAYTMDKGTITVPRES